MQKGMKTSKRIKFEEIILIHVIIIVISYSCLAASFIFTPEKLEKNEGLAALLPQCVFKKVTGYPCPTCGMGRAFSSLSHREFRRAFEFNKLSFVLYPAFILAAVFAPLSLLYHIFFRLINSQTFPARKDERRK